MPDDAPLSNVPTIFVTANDGTLFSCTAHRLGAATGAAQLRWKVTDATGLELVGPTYVRAQSPAETQRVIAEWWDAMKALEHSGTAARGPSEGSSTG